MHKNRLQELCHKRMWVLPAYTSSRDGPDHDPRFGASVVVNGHKFDAPNLSKSVKEAHNNAAEVALDHISSIASTSSTSTNPAGNAPPAATEIQTSYKAQLQYYVQKRNIGVLKYDSVREGSAHALRFKARVTVDGQTFESSEYFSTLREAEHSAARVALMSLPLEENHQVEPNLYKNLLQQLVQKEGLSLPLYNTLFNGASHMPSFTCTVVVEGESFVGDVARTKRQAEMNAAKVAWYHFKERINGQSMKVTRGEVIDNLEQPKNHSARPSFIKTKDSNQSGEGNAACLTKVIQSAAGLSLKCQVKHDDSSISLRNQLTDIDVMDRPNLNSIPISTWKMNENQKAKGATSVSEQQKDLSVPTSIVKIKEEKQANGKVEDNEKVVQENQLTDIDVMDQPNLNSIPISTWKMKENQKAKGATSVSEQQKDLSVPTSNVKIKEEKQANGKLEDNERVVKENQLTDIDVMDQPNLNSIPTSTLKMKENQQAKGATSVSEQQKGLSVPTSNVKIKEEKQANGKVEDNERVVNTTSIVMNEPDDDILSDGSTDLQDLFDPKLYSLLKLNFDDITKEEESNEDGSSEDTDTDTITDINADDHKIVDSPLLCNRVRVYPRKSDMILPVGATLLPFSDDAWVAASLDFSEHDDNLPTIS